MKDFPSTASRRRTITSIVRACGWGFCVLAGGWLLWVVCVRPYTSNSTSDSTLTFSPVTTQPSHPEVMAILASRSLQPEVRILAVTTAPAPQPIHPPDLEVIATIVNPGQTPSAFVRSKASKKMVTVRPGNEFEGATVKSITEGQVVMELRGQEFPIQVGRKGS
jgi:hypothetical protein